MATEIRVLLVGPPPITRGLGERLEASGFHVVGQVSTPADIGGDESIDVVLIADDRLVDEMAGRWRDPTSPALVVLTRDDRIISALGGRGLPGWAVAPPDSADAHLSAAIAAAASGFAVTPASSPQDEADEEEYAHIEALTAREREVLELVSQGLPNKAIASRLGISDHTVKFHLSAIFSKLGVATRTEAVRRGVRAGLINF